MLSDKYKKLSEETKSPYLKEQWLKEARNAVVQENIRGKATGRLRNPNIPTGADAMKMDVNAVENKRRYKRLQDLDGKLLEKLKRDSERHPIRKWTTTALGRKLGKACKIEGKKAQMENERGCLISEINETLPDEDKGDFKRLRELSDELMEAHIKKFKEVGEMMNMKVGKGKRMKEEMKVYERNIGVGKEENMGIFMKNIQKEEKCEEKIDNILEKHQKQLRQCGEERRHLYRQVKKEEKERKKCSEELKDGKIKAKAYVEKTKKRIAELETYKKAITNKVGGRKKRTRKKRTRKKRTRKKRTRKKRTRKKRTRKKRTRKKRKKRRT